MTYEYKNQPYNIIILQIPSNFMTAPCRKYYRNGNLKEETLYLKNGLTRSIKKYDEYKKRLEYRAEFKRGCLQNEKWYWQSGEVRDETDYTKNRCVMI